MTAESLVLLLLLAATLLAAGLGALILSAFGPTGWVLILALALAGLVLWRMLAAQLAARADWNREDLTDEWRAG